MKYIILSLSAIFLLACQNRPKLADDNTNNVSQSISVRADNELSFMKNPIGKYPYEIDFFNIPIIKQRLQALAGEHLEQIEKCAVQSPITEFEDNYINISVCFPHECHMVYCEIFINKITDNISLYYRNYDKQYFLSEDGEIGIEFDRWKSN